MSRTGCCYDNAVMERFFWLLKQEWTNHCVFANIAAARASVFNYIEVFYNHERIHETLGYLTPEQYEAVNAPASKVAYRTQPGVRQWWATASQQNTRSVVLPLCAQDDPQPH